MCLSGFIWKSEIKSYLIQHLLNFPRQNNPLKDISAKNEQQFEVKQFQDALFQKYLRSF